MHTAKLSSRFQVARRNSNWSIKCKISWVMMIYVYSSLFLIFCCSRYIQHVQWRKCLIVHCKSNYIQRYWFSNSHPWNIYVNASTCCTLVDTYHIDQMQDTLIHTQMLLMFEIWGLPDVSQLIFLMKTHQTKWYQSFSIMASSRWCIPRDSYLDPCSCGALENMITWASAARDLFSGI